MNYPSAHSQTIQFGDQQQYKLNAQASENNYWHFREGDFETGDRPAIMPHDSYGRYYFPDRYESPGNDWDAAAPQFVAESLHKQKHPLFAIKWMKEGKRLITGTSNGDILTWNAPVLTYSVSTVHKGERVQSITLSNFEKFIISGDKQGIIVYSNTKMSKKNEFDAHPNSCIRDLSFSESSLKFVSCADDGRAKVWDFVTSTEELVFTEHRSDLKSCDWHPTKSLILTGSKDQYVKIWDPRQGGRAVNEIHAHNTTINQVRWNPVNGNWFLTGSRDHKIKVFDIRKINAEVNCFEGHEDQVTVVTWHPHKEELFASASHNGQIIFWLAKSAGREGMLHRIDNAHKQMIWGMSWHPSGQMLASSGNDQRVRLWSIQRPYEPLHQPNPFAPYPYMHR